MKICKKCGIEKELTEYHTNNAVRDGLQPKCKTCIEDYNKLYYDNNAEKEKVRNKKYKDSHREHCLAYSKEYYENNTEKEALRHKKYRENNKEKVAKAQRKRYDKNKKELNSAKNEYDKIRRKHDPTYKLKQYLRNRINASIVNTERKAGSAIRDLGCTPQELKKHLESLFQEEMTWDNYGNGEGKWNVDHIIPLASVDLSNREDFLKVAHYTNLQPLWWIDNLRKSDKCE